MLVDLIDRSSISAKFIGLGGTILILFILSSAVVIKLSVDIGKEIHHIAVHDIALTEILTQISEHQLDQEIAFEKALKYSIWLDSTNKKSTVAKKFQAARIKFVDYSQTVNNEIEQADKLLNDAITETKSEDKQTFSFLLTQLNQYKTEHLTYEKDVLASFKIIDQGNWREAYDKTEAIEKQQSELELLLEKQVTAIQQLTHKALIAVDKKEQTIINLNIANVIFNIVVIFLMTSFIGSRIKQHVEQSLAAVKQMCAGNFSQSLSFNGNDEIGRINQSLNQLSDTTNSVLGQVQEKLQAIASGELASPLEVQG